MKMTRRNFISTSAATMLACGVSLSAHAAGSESENGLNFITDIFSDPAKPGTTQDATPLTAEKNAEWYSKLDFSDRREFGNAERGMLDNAEETIIYNDDGTTAWDLPSYGDLSGDAPDTVNPSLWRNTQLNAKAGLYEVCNGIYQVRGFDMSNATFIRTDNGWIIFDVLMCRENMQAAKTLMEKRFGTLDVKAVLYSHSHVDHFGGAEGAIDRNNVADSSLSIEQQLASGKTVVLAPEGFLKHAICENVYAGIAMARRAQYQYGTVLEKGSKGALSIGIGTMVTYASYFKPDTNLRHTALNVTILDTLVAVLAGVVIFPAVFSVGIEPSSGPSLVFITLPGIFNSMPLSMVWSSVFFLLLVVAALTSTISLHEVITAYMHEEWHMSRRAAAWSTTGACMALAAVASLSLGVLKGWNIFGLTIFDSLDYLTANILLPAGGFFTCIFVGWRLDRKILKAEISNNGTLKFRIYGVFIFLVRYVCPAVLLLIFLDNLGLF